MHSDGDNRISPWRVTAWLLCVVGIASIATCGCAPKPAPAVQHYKTSDFVRPVKTKIVEVEKIVTVEKIVEKPAKIDPRQVPVADDPKQHPRYDKSLGCIVPEGYVKLSDQPKTSRPLGGSGTGSSAGGVPHRVSSPADFQTREPWRPFRRLRGG
jgi:hypothetical protein